MPQITGRRIKSKDCTDLCPKTVLQINIPLPSYRSTKSAGSFPRMTGLKDRSKAGHRLEEKKIKCGRKTRGWVLDQSGGRNGGMLAPSFLLRGGELLHPSDLVQQLWDKVLQNQQNWLQRQLKWKSRTGWMKKTTHLSRFKTVNQ